MYCHNFAVFGFCNHGAGPPQPAAPRSPTAIVSQLRAARRSQVGFYWVMHFVMRLGWYLSGNTDSRSDAFGLSQVRKQKLAKTRANAEAMQKSSSRSLLVAGSSYGLGIDKTDMEEESCGLPAYGGGTSEDPEAQRRKMMGGHGRVGVRKSVVQACVNASRRSSDPNSLPAPGAMSYPVTKVPPSTRRH